MALDFAQIDNDGIITGNVPIGIEAHANIFDKMDIDRYKYLERIRDYYSDTIYYSDDLSGLMKDLIALRDDNLSVDCNIVLIESMIELVVDTISKKYRIEVISD